jgi:hypothetical protein
MLGMRLMCAAKVTTGPIGNWAEGLAIVPLRFLISRSSYLLIALRVGSRGLGHRWSRLFRRADLILGAPMIAGFLLTSCGRPPEPPIDIQLFQNWQLQPGESVAGRRILGGLGDLSVELKGKPIYAPFNGKVQPTKTGCVAFSSPELPSYLLRLCGLDRPKTGVLQKGDEIGAGEILQFAALRKQPNGKWAIVEPSKSILQQTLSHQS